MCDLINWRETHTNLTVSFRLERGGQFESGFQLSFLQTSTLESLLTNPETGKTVLLPVFARPRFVPDVSFDFLPCPGCGGEVKREERRTAKGYFITRLFCACGCSVKIS